MVLEQEMAIAIAALSVFVLMSIAFRRIRHSQRQQREQDRLRVAFDRAREARVHGGNRLGRGLGSLL